MSTTTVSKTLTMKFKTEGEKALSVSVRKCKDELPEQTVGHSMDELIASGAFAAELHEKESYDIVERTRTKY